MSSYGETLPYLGKGGSWQNECCQHEGDLVIENLPSFKHGKCTLNDYDDVPDGFLFTPTVSIVI